MIKTKYSWGRALALTVCCMLMFVTAFGSMGTPVLAYDGEKFSVGDFEYEVISESAKTVKVTGSTGFIENPAIPGTIKNGSNTYKVTTIGDNAFKDGYIVGSLTIPNTVTYIGANAFYNCSSLTGNLTIPNSVINIGDGAFQNCYGFTGNLIIPDSVKAIADRAFQNCGFTGNLKIPGSTKTIGESAFDNCDFTGNLIIPGSVKTIGDGAFDNCKGFTGSLVIPDGVTSIGEYAFSNCTGFTGSLVIPGSVTSAGEGAFYDLKGISNIYFQKTVPPIIGYVCFALAHIPAYDDNPLPIKIYVPKGSKTAYNNYLMDKDNGRLNYWSPTFYEASPPTITGKVTSTDTINLTAGYKKYSKTYAVAGDLNPTTTLTTNTAKATIANKKLTIPAKLPVGTYKVVVQASSFMGKATKTVTVKVKAKPGKVARIKYKNGKKKITVSWKKNTKATGYEIQYSTNKKFKKGKKITKTVTIKKNSTVKTTIKKLKAKKTYYVKVRAFAKDDTGKKQYGKWSKPKKIKTK